MVDSQDCVDNNNVMSEALRHLFKLQSCLNKHIKCNYVPPSFAILYARVCPTEIKSIYNSCRKLPHWFSIVAVKSQEGGGLCSCAVLWRVGVHSLCESQQTDLPDHQTAAEVMLRLAKDVQFLPESLQHSLHVSCSALLTTKISIFRRLHVGSPVQHFSTVYHELRPGESHLEPLGPDYPSAPHGKWKINQVLPESLTYKTEGPNELDFVFVHGYGGNLSQKRAI